MSRSALTPFVPRVLVLEDLTVAAGASPVIAELARVPVLVAGQTFVQLSCWIGAVDFLVPADASNTILEQAFRSVGGGLGPITANRIDKQAVGGAGTFAADVSFIAVGGAPSGGMAPLNLHAQNVAGADRRGRVVVWWSFNVAAL